MTRWTTRGPRRAALIAALIGVPLLALGLPLWAALLCCLTGGAVTDDHLPDQPFRARSWEKVIASTKGMSREHDGDPESWRRFQEDYLTDSDDAESNDRG